MDVADQAQELEELHLSHALKHISLKSPSFSGFCLNCEEPVIERRYCDSHCREAHEKTTRRR